jgi:hypothetical protein
VGIDRGRAWTCCPQTSSGSVGPMSLAPTMVGTRDEMVGTRDEMFGTRNEMVGVRRAGKEVSGHPIRWCRESSQLSNGRHIT